VDKTQALTAAYKQLIDHTLPAAYMYPVRYNHCFGRIILNWLLKDFWYLHLQKSKPAVSQLTVLQLQAAVDRMQAWLQNLHLLTADNPASLQYRK
jgi:hypothetical protein